MKPEVSWFLLRRRGRHCLQAKRRVRLDAPRTAKQRLIPRWCVQTHPTSCLPVLLVLTFVFAPAAMAAETVHLECTPRTFRVVPGEPMRLELTIQADSAARVRLHVPGHPSLKLRAVEKLPVRRTPQGVIVHRRVVVWQALEPGLVKIDKLSVETRGRKLLFPEVTITAGDPGP